MKPGAVDAKSLPARERGSKRSTADTGRSGSKGRSPRGSADRNRPVACSRRRLPCRSPRGSADRNRARAIGSRCAGVAPRAGARIETTISAPSRAPGAGRSPRGSADRNPSHSTPPPASSRRSPRGSADRNASSNGPNGVGASSLPARERGSKRVLAIMSVVAPSRSPRGSADRNSNATNFFVLAGVAPRAGARIETSRSAKSCRRSKVAPRAGARIETRVDGTTGSRLYGRSPRGSADRNLFHEAMRTWPGVAPRAGARIETSSWLPVVEIDRVAPRAGARIETPSPTAPSRSRWSLPARERGSKHAGAERHDGGNASLPARERGSKRLHSRSSGDPHRRSPRGSADRNVVAGTDQLTANCRSPRGSADRNADRRGDRRRPPASLPARERGSKLATSPTRRRAPRSRSPRGSADRNTLLRAHRWLHTRSLPARERGSKQTAPTFCARLGRRSPRGSADRNVIDTRVDPIPLCRSPRGSADRNHAAA